MGDAILMQIHKSFQYFLHDGLGSEFGKPRFFPESGGVGFAGYDCVAVVLLSLLPTSLLFYVVD